MSDSPTPRGVPEQRPRNRTPPWLVFQSMHFVKTAPQGREFHCCRAEFQVVLIDLTQV